MRYLSVCSGIEAATVAWGSLGWVPVGFAEIEAFPNAVLAHHYPHVPNFGDVNNFKDWPDAAFDVLVGGTPCQSFSVAGLRKGLADPRGNLALTYLAIADRYRPEWLVWENVPGVLSSSGGRDFGAFLGGLGELGYGWAYRVLDAQYVRVDGFGRAVPQRRRRVIVVGHSRDWRPAAAVLFERESLSWHPPPRREAREGVAPTISSRPTGGGGLGTDVDLDGGLIAHALRADGFDASEDGTGRGTPIVPVVAKTLTRGAESAGRGGYAGRRQEDDENIIAFDTTQITSPANYSNPQPGGPSHPLAESGHPPAVAFMGERNGNAAQIHAAEVLRTLREAVGAQAFTQWGLAVAASLQSPEILRPPMHGPSIRCKAGEARPGLDDGTLACAESLPAGSLRDLWINGPDRRSPQGRQLAKQLAAELGTPLPFLPSENSSWAVRRLTPIECERLMGFPDNWTLIPWRGKPAADGPRYKALGNSMAVNVVRWLGQRIDMVSALASSEAA